MTAIETGAKRGTRNIRNYALALLACTTLAGLPHAAMAQEATDPAATSDDAGQDTATDPQSDVIRTISVRGVQRLEPNTILSYVRMRPGDVYTAAAADQALKDLAATELFESYSITNEDGNVVIDVVENPVINRIVLEGNKRLKDDKIVPEIKLAPRQIFTRSKVRADVARIIELYKRQGRFAATVEPKTVQLSQNRVDLVFEITEGPKSRVQKINIIGNEHFSDGQVKGEMVTHESGLFSFLKGNTSYDPDRLAFDQQKLREFYLTQGYVDFRVVSAVAELTPDKRDFIITYVVEEGERYKFGKVDVTSQIRDLDGDILTKGLAIEEGEWYDAKRIEDTVEGLTELAGQFGYAFADVRPEFRRNPDDLTMDVTLAIREAPRVYIERIDVNGNTLTQDKVIRREFRSAEGDAFNTLAVKRTSARINSLGYFQEEFEVSQAETANPDRIILEANVQEQPTGELQLSAGFSSLESFLFSGSIRQRNFRGRGQTIGASASISRYSKSINLSFTEPYVFDRNISLGVDFYRRDVNSFNLINRDQTRYSKVTTGGSVRLGVPLTEYSSLIGSYTLNYDQVTIDEREFFRDVDGDGTSECDPLLASRFICDTLGNRLSSILGLNYVYNSLNSYYRPSRGTRLTAGIDFAGLGGDTRYVRLRGQAAKYWPVMGDFIFSLSGEGGYIKGFGGNGPRSDEVLLTDRFFLGEPQIRGFDIRGCCGSRSRTMAPATPSSSPTAIVAATMRSAVTPIISAGPSWKFRSVRVPARWGCGRRSSSMSAPCSTSTSRSCRTVRSRAVFRSRRVTCRATCCTIAARSTVTATSSRRPTVSMAAAIPWISSSSATLRRSRRFSWVIVLRPASRWGSVSTGTRPSVRSGSISLTSSARWKATTPRQSHSM